VLVVFVVAQKKGDAQIVQSPFMAKTGGSYLFFAAFFLPPLAFFAICNPPFRWLWIASNSPYDPAHSAAWHVGPGAGVLASRATPGARGA
jgi:hypothetical protein